MNKNVPLPAAEVGILTSPAYPKPGHRILVELRQRLNLNAGYEIEFTQLGKMFGLPRSTISNWFTHVQNPAIQLLFGLLERLPENERNAFVQGHCRILPTLDHVSFASEPAIIDHVRSLLSRPAGLTLISGQSDYARHFLLTAIGNSFSQQDAKHRPIAGLICKPPGRLVPLNRAFYLAADLSPEMALRKVNHLWPKIRDAAPMLLLDGVWLRAPHKRAEILKLSLARHVVLADEFGPGEPPVLKETQLTRLEVAGSPGSTLQVKIRR